ncbi:MAG: hypothetical protein KGD57_08680 [Candidatus Lokiarchaeota archaeon]|nr:hypothetical protein [Candidatus Lokiarchaeota archaeon]
MEKNELLGKLLAEYLEKIIFNDIDLRSLKDNIENLEMIGEEKKKLIKIFISHLAIVYERLNDKLPFYFESYLTKLNAINPLEKSNTENTDLSKIKVELNEKNKFLTDLGFRINEIYKKLT